MLYIYLIMLSFALPIFSMSDDVKHKRKVLKKINAAKNKEKKAITNLKLPEPVKVEKITIASPLPEYHGVGWEIKINRETFIEAVRNNDAVTIKNARPEHLRSTYDDQGNNLMQILLQNESAPNIYLLKRLIPLTHWTHYNNNKQSVLDLLDLNSEKHSTIAPFIIKTLYQYVIKKPNVSKNEDVTKTCGYSMRPMIDPKDNKNTPVPVEDENPAEKKKKLMETQLKIVKSYIEDTIKGRR